MGPLVVAFAARHRMLSAVALVHVPLILGVAVWRGVLDSGRVDRARRDRRRVRTGLACAVPPLRASLVGFALMMTSTVLLHVSGGQTDIHIHFYVMLALVALYQDWSPFLVAIAMVGGHHLILGSLQADAVFSDPAAQENPPVFALLHVGLLLAMAVGLAVGWRYTEQAGAGRRARGAARSARAGLVSG